MTKKKWYVVWEGKVPGIYSVWDEAKLQVYGYPGAKYKSFQTHSEAKAAFQVGPNACNDGKKKHRSDYILNSISVDAACSGNPGIVEYQGVYTDTKTVLFHKKIEGIGTNNCGEFLAIIHALSWQKHEQCNRPIYSDSDVAIGWVNKKKCKTSLEKNTDTAPIFQLIQAGESWLMHNEVHGHIMKWQTKDWGEIPADFGRKK